MKTAARKLGAAAIVLGLAVLAGCGKTPERVCEKFESLMKDAKDMPKGKDDRAVCVQQMSEMKAKDPAGFECTADCVMGAGDLASAIRCMTKCSPDKK